MVLGVGDVTMIALDRRVVGLLLQAIQTTGIIIMVVLYKCLSVLRDVFCCLRHALLQVFLLQDRFQLLDSLIIVRCVTESLDPRLTVQILHLLGAELVICLVRSNYRVLLDVVVNH